MLKQGIDIIKTGFGQPSVFNTDAIIEELARQGKTLEELSLEAYKQFSPRFGEDVYSITVGSSLAARDNIGGTAPKRVEQALVNARKAIEESPS